MYRAKGKDTTWEHSFDYVGQPDKKVNVANVSVQNVQGEQQKTNGFALPLVILVVGAIVLWMVFK